MIATWLAQGHSGTENSGVGRPLFATQFGESSFNDVQKGVELFDEFAQLVTVLLLDACSFNSRKALKTALSSDTLPLKA